MTKTQTRLRHYFMGEYNLSLAESKVAELLISNSFSDICDKLCISPKTVKFHMTSIYKKMEVSSITDFYRKIIVELF